jgi:hypothetical protein
MTARTLILTTGAILALAAPAAADATAAKRVPAKKVPAKAVTKVHRPVLKAPASTPAPSGAPVIGPSCAEVDPSYTRCVRLDRDASQPTPIVVGGSSLPIVTVLLSPLDNGTQDG